MKEKLIVFGSGEFGVLIANIINFLDEYEIVAFGDDNSTKIGTKLVEKDIYSMIDLIEFSKENKIKSAICAIGNNKIRKEKYHYLKNKNFRMISVVHPKALIDSNVSFGKNVIIEMGTAIHTQSKIGNNVFLGGDALIGHHNIIGNHVLIGGNVSLGGSVKIDDCVSIGVGASIKPGIKVGKGSVVGVGAAVVKDVEPYTTVVGVPAKPINNNE